MTQMQTPGLGTRAPNGAPAPGPVSPPLSVRSFGATDRGMTRENNEDQFVIASLMKALWVQQSSLPQSGVQYANHRGNLFMVADGVGGARSGEKASALAVSAMEGLLLDALHWLLSLDGAADASVLREFQSALWKADATVCAVAAQNPGLRGMGTTLTMAYSLDADLFVAHVGDSRCYLQRGGVLRQLTRDHTLAQHMVERGLLAPENVADYEFRNVITNVVGGSTPGVQVELHRVRLEPGDTLLLCTDGLTGMVPDGQIARVLQAAAAPQTACQELIRLANEQGGKDNVTVVVARYTPKS